MPPTALTTASAIVKFLFLLDSADRIGLDISTDEPKLSGEPMITITEQAALKLKELLSTQEQPDLYLRLFINPGGCEGFSYGMGFDAERRGDDQVFEREGVRVLVDAESMHVLRGAQIDYARSQLGEGFTIRNPNAISTCGCGHSFTTRHDAGQPEPCGEEAAPQTHQA